MLRWANIVGQISLHKLVKDEKCSKDEDEKEEERGDERRLFDVRAAHIPYIFHSFPCHTYTKFLTVNTTSWISLGKTLRKRIQVINEPSEPRV